MKAYKIAKQANTRDLQAIENIHRIIKQVGAAGFVARTQAWYISNQLNSCKNTSPGRR